jgi:hypothetical protein
MSLIVRVCVSAPEPAMAASYYEGGRRVYRFSMNRPRRWVNGSIVPANGRATGANRRARRVERDIFRGEWSGFDGG